MSNIQTTKLIGTEITTSAVFKNSADVKFIPSAVKLIYKLPDNVVVTQIILPNSSNLFTFTKLLDVVGKWVFRWESSGASASADEFTVIVEKSLI